VGSIVAIAYGRKQRRLLRLAALRVDGRSIDSLNAANLRRRLNRSLVIQEAQNVATVHGEDLTLSWQCTGYCRTEQESLIEFSIDTDNNIPFGELECFAYDLHNDPALGRHPDLGYHRGRPIFNLHPVARRILTGWDSPLPAIYAAYFRRFFIVHNPQVFPTVDPRSAAAMATSRRKQLYFEGQKSAGMYFSVGKT